MCENSDDDDSFNNPRLPSIDSSDSDDLAITKDKPHKKYPTFNPRTSVEHIEFQPGMIFTSREQLREAIRDYGVTQQRKVWIKRNDNLREQAKCREGCKWNMWASRVKDDVSYQIKTYEKQHSCIIVSKQRMVKADWLEKQFVNTIRSNPRWKLKDFQEATKAKYKIICTSNQCWWAKKIASRT